MIVLEFLGAALTGLASAALMTVSEFPFWVRWGIEGVGEWQVDTVIYSALLRRKAKWETKFPWSTIATHLLNGIIASVAFRFLLPVFILFIPDARISILWDALVYSFVLWILFPVLGRASIEAAGNTKISDRGLLVSLLSHFVYGLFLGLFLPHLLFA